MAIGVNTLKSLLSNTLLVAVAALFCTSTAIVHAADIQPGQQIFCTFSNNKTGMNRYNLNLKKQFKAYLVNDKRKIALTFSRALDSQRLLWNIPANAKLGNYTFKVVKKQKKNRKQYFNCGKPKDYRLTNTPSNIAITETTDGTLITNIEGISQGSSQNNGYGASVTMIQLQPDNGLVWDGGTITVDPSFVLNSGSFQNYAGTHYTASTYTQNDGSLTVNGGSVGDFKFNIPDITECVEKININYSDFTAFSAATNSSSPICTAFEQYKTYISDAVSNVVAACPNVAGDLIESKLASITQMQTDAALIAGCDTPSQ